MQKQKSLTSKVTLHAEETLFEEMKEVADKLTPLLRDRKMEGKNPVQIVLSALMVKFFIPQIMDDTPFHNVKLPTNNTIDRSAQEEEGCIFSRNTGDTATKTLLHKFPTMKPAAARTLLVSRINNLKKQVKKGGLTDYKISLEKSLQGFLD